MQVSKPAVVRGKSWHLRNTNTTGFADFEFLYRNPGDLHLFGDWDGNGTDTVGVVRDGTWYLRNSNEEDVADFSSSRRSATATPATSTRFGRPGSGADPSPPGADGVRTRASTSLPHGSTGRV